MGSSYNEGNVGMALQDPIVTGSIELNDVVITSTAAELNKLDSVTASATDIEDAASFIYVTGETGELTTLIGDAVTIYHVVFRAPYAMELISFHVRTEAKETTANATMDVLKTASATAITAGTGMATQIDPDTLTNATDQAFTINTDNTEDLVAGDMIVFKVVSGAAVSGLKHLAYTAKLQRTA